MKITTNPATGELTFDLPDDQAVALLRQLIVGVATNRQEVLPVEQSLVLATPTNGSHRTNGLHSSTPVVSLSPTLYTTWSFMVDNDNPRGVALSAVARGLRITRPAASYRLNHLTRLGVLDRIGRGRYRILDGTQDVTEAAEEE